MMKSTIRDYLNKQDEIYSIALQLFEEMMEERPDKTDRITWFLI